MIEMDKLMNEGQRMLNQPKNRKVAAVLAFAGAISPVPLAGLHKFYLGQPIWGILYLLLEITQIPRIAAAVEGVWYMSQNEDSFNTRFNPNARSSTTASAPTETVDPQQVGAIAEALRELDRLRQDGLISEYEFEQKRRQWLDRMQ